MIDDENVDDDGNSENDEDAIFGYHQIKKI